MHNTIDDISSTVKTTTITTATFSPKKEQIFFEKKEKHIEEDHPHIPNLAEEIVQQHTRNEENEAVSQPIVNNTNDKVQKMVVILKGGDNQNSLRNHTKTALETNKWPQFEPEARILYKPESESESQNTKLSKYPWQNENKSGSKTYPRNFAYHRVTGHPLYHANFDKNPKAYIAVSVIAPKPLHSRPQDEDLILENELRQLKPWTHKQNLKNMAAIRSRWVIQSENNNKETTAP